MPIYSKLTNLLLSLDFGADFVSVCCCCFFSSEKSRWGFRKSLFMHLTSNDFKINDNSTFWYPRRFWFCIFYLLDPVGACKLLHRIVKFIAQMYSLDQWKRYFYCSIPFFFSIVWYIICIRIEGVSEISN